MVLSAALAAASCGLAQSPATPADARQGEAAYLPPPSVTLVESGAETIALGGRAVPGARVQLTRPGGGALGAQADSAGRWRISAPATSAAQVFGLSQTLAGRTVQAEGYVFISPEKGASGEPSSNLFTRLFKAIWETVYLGNQVFFLNDNISIFNVVVSAIFFGISLYIVIKKYRGNKTLIGFLAITWIIFLYASSNYPDEHFYSHRKILLWFAPILLAIASLAYLNFTKTFDRILGLVLAIIIGYSIATNLYFNQRYLASKYGSERLLSVADTVEIINILVSTCRISISLWRRSSNVT